MPGPARSLVRLTLGQLATLGRWFLPERPGPLIAQHVIATGHGSCLADRWPDPRALAVETGGNWTLAGDPGALDPAALRGRAPGAPPPGPPPGAGSPASWRRRRGSSRCCGRPPACSTSGPGWS
jgi:hypothetical protein